MSIKNKIDCRISVKVDFKNRLYDISKTYYENFKEEETNFLTTPEVMPWNTKEI